MSCEPSACPVPSVEGYLDHLAEHVLPARTALARGHLIAHAPDGSGPPGSGDVSRFSPVDGAAHAYAARATTAAILETAMRDLDATSRLVTVASLRPWAVTRVETMAPLRLADLRDPILADLGIEPENLTAATPEHYGCTRSWAQGIHDLGYDGIVWHSRQASLHRRLMESRHGLAEELLTHGQVEAFVAWMPPAATPFLRPLATPLALAPDGEPDALVADLASLLGIYLEH